MMLRHCNQNNLSKNSFWFFLFLLAIPSSVFSQEEAEAVSIQDNSFLIEEAYNQEKGIIQHIFNWVPSWDVNRGIRHRETNFLFTPGMADFFAEASVFLMPYPSAA